MSRTSFLALVALAGLSSAGGSPTLSYSEFQKLPYEEREVKIVLLSPRDQIEAYLAMMDESEPPDLELAVRIAPGGAPLVAAITSRLEVDKSEVRQLDMLRLLSQIHRGRFADLSKDKSLIGTLERTVAEMHDQMLKRHASRELEVIRSTPSPRFN